MADKPEILVVEDESIVATDIKQMIERLGYEVPDVLSRAENVFEAVREYRPNLILMDIRLQGEMNGIEAAEVLREDFNLPVVFLTAHSDEETLDRARKTEPLGFLTKPIDQNDLRSTLHVSLYRKEIEDELRLKDRAMASAEEGISIADARQDDEPLIYVNDGFVEMTGYDRDEVIGRNCRFLQGPETSEEKVDKIRKAIDDGEPITVELRNYTKGGDPFWNQLSITPVFDNNDVLTHYVGIQKDVTRRKEQEKQIRQNEKLAAIGEMAAGLMHEINNPNAFIKGNLDYMDKAWDQLDEFIHDHDPGEQITELTEEFPETLKAMRRGSNRIKDIIEKVKQFSRRGDTTTELESVNPLPLIEQSLAMAEETIDPEVDLSYNLSDELRSNGDAFTIKADPGEFEQIIINMVENASDALAEQPDGRIEVLVDGDEERFRIKISDNGPGIPEEVQQKIFDPFFTTKSTGSGTGLGLSIVSGIIERMGGRIDLESREGQGATFEMTFPQSD